MIWHNQQVISKNQPSSATINVVGIYNLPASSCVVGSDAPMIILRLEIQQPDLSSCIIYKILMEKNPSMLGAQEDPLPEDVKARYHSRVVKAHSRVKSASFSEILNWEDRRR
ncbi:MAG: hypothetical protein ACTSPB_16200 [Candidatus Thorarchaeota archaeon]